MTETVTVGIPEPVHYSPDLESLQPDERETENGLNDAFNTILEKTSGDYGHAVRSVHAKAHGILKGVMSVRGDLPQELAQGLFEHSKDHPVYLRISTNAGDILPDAVSLPRGLAIKVLDVDGNRLPDAEGRSQDFIMVNGPVFQSKTAKQFLGNLKVLAKTTDRMKGTKTVMSSVLQTVNDALEAVGVASPKIQSLGGAPNVNPLGETYFSVTPFRYGEYVAKFRLKPVSQDLTALTGKKIDISVSEDAIRETIQAEMQTVDAAWEFQVQLCRDIDRQPIEDPTVEWSEEEAPFVTVATIRAGPQDSWSADKVQRVDEEMRFSVWTGLSAHRPLGNINRARKAAYQHSSDFRQNSNRCPIHEP